MQRTSSNFLKTMMQEDAEIDGIIDPTNIRQTTIEPLIQDLVCKCIITIDLPFKLLISFSSMK